MIKEICDTVALPPNFEVWAIDAPEGNAYARIASSKRQIIYDRRFMQNLADTGSRDWTGLVIFAHEIGHHLCGHTLDNVGTRPPEELEADHFAGFAAGTLGASLDQAARIFAEKYKSDGSATHPPSSERVLAIGAGWRKASGRQAGEERLSVITHNTDGAGKAQRVIVEFANRRDHWEEIQHGKYFADFRELARTGQSIFLHDSLRAMWVRLDLERVRTATGYWAEGSESVIPSKWAPLDPGSWR